MLSKILALIIFCNIDTSDQSDEAYFSRIREAAAILGYDPDEAVEAANALI